MGRRGDVFGPVEVVGMDTFSGNRGKVNGGGTAVVA